VLEVEEARIPTPVEVARVAIDDLKCEMNVALCVCCVIFYASRQLRRNHTTAPSSHVIVSVLMKM